MSTGAPTLSSASTGFASSAPATGFSSTNSMAVAAPSSGGPTVTLSPYSASKPDVVHGTTPAPSSSIANQGSGSGGDRSAEQAAGSAAGSFAVGEKRPAPAEMIEPPPRPLPSAPTQMAMLLQRRMDLLRLLQSRTMSSVLSVSTPDRNRNRSGGATPDKGSGRRTPSSRRRERNEETGLGVRLGADLGYGLGMHRVTLQRRPEPLRRKCHWDYLLEEMVRTVIMLCLPCVSHASSLARYGCQPTSARSENGK